MESQVTGQRVAGQTEEQLPPTRGRPAAGRGRVPGAVPAGEKQRLARLLLHAVKDGFGPVLGKRLRHEVERAHGNAAGQDHDVPIGRGLQSRTDRFQSIGHVRRSPRLDALRTRHGRKHRPVGIANLARRSGPSAAANSAPVVMMPKLGRGITRTVARENDAMTPTAIGVTRSPGDMTT